MQHCWYTEVKRTFLRTKNDYHPMICLLLPRGRCLRGWGRMQGGLNDPIWTSTFAAFANKTLNYQKSSHAVHPTGTTSSQRNSAEWGVYIWMSLSIKYIRSHERSLLFSPLPYCNFFFSRKETDNQNSQPTQRLWYTTPRTSLWKSLLDISTQSHSWLAQLVRWGWG